MMNRRSFLHASAVGLPAFGAVSLALPPPATAAMDPIVAHLLAETKQARGHLKSTVTAREVRGLRTMATNMRLLKAHGKSLHLRTQLIEAHRRFNQLTPTAQKTAAAAVIARVTTLFQQQGIPWSPIGDPLAFTKRFPGQIIDFDKMMTVASRTFDAIAADRVQLLKPAAFRRQDSIDVCLTNADDGWGGCPMPDEGCDSLRLFRMIVQASVIMFGAMCGACEGLVLLFQLDAFAFDVIMYWNGC